MIWSVEARAKRVPVASIYGADGTVELIEGYSDPSKLIVLTGTAGHRAMGVGLLEPVANRADYSLALGVFDAGLGADRLEALREELDAVIVVPDGEAAPVARRLALAITTPGEPFHPWCCDWNDMRSLVSGARRGLGRCASARASGHFAAMDLAMAALDRIGDIQGCRVLSLLTGPQGMTGALVKEVSAAIGARVGGGDYIPGVLQDPSIADDTVQVDIFVFGPAVLRASCQAEPPALPLSGDVHEIPAFLRKEIQR